MEAVVEKPLEKQKNSLDIPLHYRSLARVLRSGKSNAITTKDIMSITGIKDKRQVHEMIEQLVNKYGHVIGSSRRGKNKGYYIIDNKSELEDTLRTYNAQITSMLNRHRNLQKNWANKDQLDLDI